LKDIISQHVGDGFYGPLCMFMCALLRNSGPKMTYRLLSRTSNLYCLAH